MWYTVPSSPKGTVKEVFRNLFSVMAPSENVKKNNNVICNLPHLEMNHFEAPLDKGLTVQASLWSIYADHRESQLAHISWKGFFFFFLSFFLLQVISIYFERVKPKMTVIFASAPCFLSCQLRNTGLKDVCRTWGAVI